MKAITLLALLLLAPFLHAQEENERVVLVPLGKAPKEVPLFFSATVDVVAKVGLKNISSVHEIVCTIHQGKAETLSLALTGRGEVISVVGEGLKDWSVRETGEGTRFLDVRPIPVEGDARRELRVRVETFTQIEQGMADLLLPGPGEATGFALAVSLTKEVGVDLRVTQAEGLLPLEDGGGSRFVGKGMAKLQLAAVSADTGSRGLELMEMALSGTLAADEKSVAFQLTAQARAREAGAVVRLLGGGASLTGGVAGQGWHVALAGKNGEYDLIAEQGGEFPLALEFVVPVTRVGDWQKLDFRLPSGVVVPLAMAGPAEGVAFDRELAVVPQRGASGWRGFLPASGDATMAWREADEMKDGALFFSSSETTDVRVGSGLIRQMSVIDLRVLQGKLHHLTMDLNGPGEVLGVTGDAVLGWSVAEDGGARRLEVRLSRPLEGTGRVVVEAQAALGGFPVETAALRMLPRGALRHSGWVRVANEGAVRVEVADAHGLIQLAPGQFPGGVDASLRQVFVYRFPSADHGFKLRADQVLPEVGVTEVTIYEASETDRRISSEVELDIREAPLREWEMEIPADHAVAAVTGAEVADYAVASEVHDGMRRLKVIFKQEVKDRQLVRLRLEKNEAVKAGEWALSPLGFPEAKSRRGYIGAVAAAGFRLTAGEIAGVAEVPVTFFPTKTTGLQQAFRLREGSWKVVLDISALGQSVQADVFHLYSLNAGAAYGSVLVNYFVVGAPATEWRIAVPQGIGNIDVTGQNVGRDWRLEGEVLVIPLSSPVLGTGTVLVTFEQPMSGRGGDLSPGEVRPLGVQVERGYVQVVSPLQVKFSVPVREGPLLKIDASELPAEFRLLSSAPTLDAWQYTGRDFKIGMVVEWFAAGETVDQVVDFMKLSSQVSRDGQWVTDARFFVKAKGSNSLRFSLPDKVALWEVKVDGAAVNAREDVDGTLIPLPALTNSDQAVEIALRYGGSSENPKRATLVAPRLGAPMVIGEWRVTGDDARQLVARGGTAELVRPALAESGWEWFARHTGEAVTLILTTIDRIKEILGVSSRSGVGRVVAILAGLMFLLVVVSLTTLAWKTERGNSDVLEYAAPVVAAGEVIAVEIGNVVPWQSRSGWGMWLLFAAGTGIVLRGWLTQNRWWRGCGLALVAAGILSIHGGAPLFLGVMALVSTAWWLPLAWEMIGHFRRPKAAGVAAMVALTCIGFSKAKGEEIAGMRAAESMTQDWKIHDGRLHGTLNVTVRAGTGERFLLLREPAVLTQFEGAGLKVVKSLIDGQAGYFLIAEAEGRLSGQAEYEMPLANPVKGWEMPSGPAALRQVTVRWDEAGWEFFSPGAARVTELAGLLEGESGAVIVPGPVETVTIQARALQRDVASEETRFFAEVSNLYLPGPGVVNGRHRLSIRPAQGRVSQLVMKVPTGFTVSDVVDGPVGAWRYDPEKLELRVPVEPAQDAAFFLTVETQRGAGSLPMDLALEPLRVGGAAGEIGFLALAFGDDAQAERMEVDGLSPVNPGDFDGGLVPRDETGKPLALLRHAWRYGAGEVAARVKVTAVAPELRAESYQLVSLGEDRLVVATDLTVTISRSGVFKLELELPDGLEIETATGEGLSHWTEGKIDGMRVVTLQLAGRTLGKRVFSLTMTAPPTGSRKDWQVPRLSLRGATRESGVVTLVPERGLQVLAVSRRNVSQIDPRELADAPEETAQAAVRPGALAYRLLQSDWALGLDISRLDAWVTAKVLHEAILREGQVLTKIGIVYKIDNAAVKSLRVRIPGLDATAASTVRASGAALADLTPVAGEDGLWEIRFQRGMAGETEVNLEYQRTGKETGGELIDPIVLEEVRQLAYFATIQAGGRLEVEAGSSPRGWQKMDWSVVKSALGKMAGNVTPLMAFRLADPEGPLPVVLKRNELANLEKLRVAQGSLTTLLSPSGDFLTSVELQLEVTGKGTLRLKLPQGADLYNVLVNDEGSPLVREGDDWLFYAFPSPVTGQPATVRFVYSSASGKGVRLEGPVLNVPMENLTWRVLVPEGWRMATHGGDFDLRQRSSTGEFRLEDYQSLVRSKQESGSRSAVALLDQANSWLAAGDQEKASQAFSNAVRSNQLDAASGEDARVQLRQLKTQQAVLGLNTRRQKLSLDNRSAVAGKDQGRLDRAADANPVLRGGSNYNPREFDRFLDGNTADENAALKEIAGRIVTQQLAAEPPPAALGVTLPERGTVLTFGRSVQVEGEKPMTITLGLKRDGGGIAWLAIPLCLLLGAMGGAWRMLRTA
ncbi:MAG: hypothetical protein V4640_12965 [Verrucomicrobiota bacterium]